MQNHGESCLMLLVKFLAANTHCENMQNHDPWTCKTTFKEHKGHPSLQAMMEALPNAVVPRDSAADTSESMRFLKLYNILAHHKLNLSASLQFASPLTSLFENGSRIFLVLCSARDHPIDPTWPPCLKWYKWGMLNIDGPHMTRNP